jgi:hypothetical protein
MVERVGGKGRRAMTVALTLLALSTLAPELRAQSTTAARVLFREARALMAKDDYEQACPKLEESLRLDEGMGTQFNLAHCWEKLGRNASAWGLFLDVAALADAASQGKRAAAARQRAEALEAGLSLLRIDVESPAEGLRVLRADEEVGEPAWGTAMPVDPGTYRVEASAPGKRSWSRELEVSEPGSTISVTIPQLEDEVPMAEPIPLGVTGKDAGTEGMSAARVVTTVGLAALGVGGVVAGVLFALDNRAETNAAKELCTGQVLGVPNQCDRDANLPGFDGGTQERSELLDHREAADRSALLSYVGFGVGGAALVTAVIVLATAPDTGEEAADAAGFELQPSLAAGGSGWYGATLSGRF